MAALEYTESRNPDHPSEVIDFLIYNENTEDLYVVLRSADTYKYPFVEKDAYLAFKSAGSTGTHYNTVIKPNYGPADWLGLYHSLDGWEHVEVESKVTAAVGTPKGLTYADNAVVTNRDEEVRVTLGGDNNEARPAITHNPPPNRADSRFSLTHVVTFTIEGLEGEREFTTEVMNVSQAVSDLEEYASQLGLTIKVKKVVVYFD